MDDLSVKAYFQDKKGTTSELVATFYDEETYNACRPTLGGIARKARLIITESCENEDKIPEALTFIDKMILDVQKLRDSDFHVCPADERDPVTGEIIDSTRECTCGHFDNVCDNLLKLRKMINGEI